jgi:hypothetical protein
MRVDVNAVRPARLRHAILERCAAQLGRAYRKSARSVGVGIGCRQRSGRVEPEWCVKFYVPKKVKRPRHQEPLPRFRDLRVSVAKKRYSVRVPIDVVEVGGVKLQGFVFNEKAPTDIGAPCAVVADSSGNERLLAAGHVVARNAKMRHAALGEPVCASGGAEIGTLDASPDMNVAPIDAALVHCTGDARAVLPRDGAAPVTRTASLDEVNAANHEGYRLLSWVESRPCRFVAVVKDFVIANTYAAGPVTFPLLMQFEAECHRGDSGALVVDAKGRGVCMHVLGTDADDNPAEKISFGVPLSAIFEAITPGNRSWRVVA